MTLNMPVSLWGNAFYVKAILGFCLKKKKKKYSCLACYSLGNQKQHAFPIPSPRSTSDQLKLTYDERNRDEKRKKSTKHFIEKQDMATRAFGLTGYTDSGKGEKERKTRS